MRELARRQELATLRKDLYERGVLRKEEFEEGERAQVEAAQENVKGTRRAIEDSDRLQREAEEVLSLVKSGRTREAEELLKSGRGSKNIGTP